MRHASRTHRVGLDWLFDRINVDPKIQIKHVDTKNHLADIRTKGNFTRDEWNHLFIISIFLSKLHRNDVEKNATRNRRRENIGKVETASSPAAPSSSASSRPWILRAPSQQGSNLIPQCAEKPAAGVSNQNDAASSSQVWLTDANMTERARWLLQTRTRVRFFQNVEGNLPLKLWTSMTSRTRSGRAISAYLELTNHTLRKSTRI